MVAFIVKWVGSVIVVANFGLVLITVRVVLFVVFLVVAAESDFTVIFSFEHALYVPQLALVLWLQVCYSFTPRNRKL